MLLHGSTPKLLEGVANYSTIHQSITIFWMLALGKLWGYCKLNILLSSTSPPSSLWMGDFSPLTSAQSHLLDHGSCPHWPSHHWLLNTFPCDLNYSLFFPTSLFFMVSNLPSIFNNNNDLPPPRPGKKAILVRKHYQTSNVLALWPHNSTSGTFCSRDRKRRKYTQGCYMFREKLFEQQCL